MIYSYAIIGLFLNFVPGPYPSPNGGEWKEFIPHTLSPVLPINHRSMDDCKKVADDFLTRQANSNYPDRPDTATFYCVERDKDGKLVQVWSEHRSYDLLPNRTRDSR